MKLERVIAVILLLVMGLTCFRENLIEMGIFCIIAEVFLMGSGDRA